MARRGVAGWGIVAFLVPLFGGCIDALVFYQDFDPDEHYANPGVFEGEYRFGAGSSVLTAGLHTPGVPEVVRLVSNIPAYGEASDLTTDSTVYIPMAIWKPENFTGRMPIIVDAGPYYEYDSHCKIPNENPCTEFVDDTIDTPNQSTPFLLKNFLSHGYAVVQLAVRGTGTHGGCMDLMGNDEQSDLDQAITWLGEQEWSNGNIAMIGVSYDGSTPWEVAATGNPYLKTIVPISGLPDIYDLMFHNGSAETRGAVMHSQVYYGFGFSDGFLQPPEGWPEQLPWLPPTGLGIANGREGYQDTQNLVCPEAWTGAAMGYATMTSGERHEEATDYWVQRDHRADVLANYKGSVFLVHGLQDWNVDPHAAIPFNQQLRDAGIEVKEWYGQWDHNTPDGQCRQSAPGWVTMPCRLDYAEVLYRWFDKYLRGNTTIDTGPAIQVQDAVGIWRNADSYPPTDATWLEFNLVGEELAPTASGETAVQLTPPVWGGPSEVLQFRSEPMAEDLHMSGLAQLRMPFEVAGQGGELAFWLMDEAPDGKVRAPDICPPIPFPLPIPPGCDPDRKRWMPWARTGVPVSAHGQMNLRYYAGGEDPQTLAPATRYVAQAEFEPAEILVPAGHRLLLYVFQYHFPDHQSSQTYAPITVYLGEDAKLRVPTIDLDPRTIFPVPGSNFPDRENLSRMYVLPPVFQPGSPAGLVEGVTDGVTEAIPVPVRTSPSSRNPLAPL